jgi:chromosome segregation ATPase
MINRPLREKESKKNISTLSVVGATSLAWLTLYSLLPSKTKSITNLQNFNSDILNKNVELNDSNEKLTRQLREKDEELKKLKNEIGNMKEEADGRLAKMEKEEDDRKSILLAQIEKVKAELAALKQNDESTLSTLNTTVRDKEAKLREHELNLKKSTLQNQQYIKTIDDLNRELNVMNNFIQNKDRQIEELNYKQQNLNMDYTSLKNSHEGLTKEHENLTTEHESLETEHEGLKTEHGKLKTENNGLKTEHGKLTKTHNNLKTEHDRLTDTHDKLKKSNQELSNSYNELKIVNDNLDNKITSNISTHKIYVATLKAKIEGTPIDENLKKELDQYLSLNTRDDAFYENLKKKVEDAVLQNLRYELTSKFKIEAIDDEKLKFVIGTAKIVANEAIIKFYERMESLFKKQQHDLKDFKKTLVKNLEIISDYKTKYVIEKRTDYLNYITDAYRQIMDTLDKIIEGNYINSKKSTIDTLKKLSKDNLEWSKNITIKSFNYISKHAATLVTAAYGTKTPAASGAKTPVAKADDVPGPVDANDVFVDAVEDPSPDVALKAN